MPILKDSIALDEFNARLRALRDRVRRRELRDEDRLFYAHCRAELARMLVFTERVPRRPDQPVRQALRVARELDVEIISAGGAVEHAKTLDVSIGGFAVRSGTERARGTIVEIALRIDAADVVHGDARVVSALASGDAFRVSFAFAGLAPAEQDALELIVIDCALARFAEGRTTP